MYIDVCMYVCMYLVCVYVQYVCTVCIILYYITLHEIIQITCRICSNMYVQQMYVCVYCMYYITLCLIKVQYYTFMTIPCCLLIEWVYFFLLNSLQNNNSYLSINQDHCYHVTISSREYVYDTHTHTHTHTHEGR